MLFYLGNIWAKFNDLLWIHGSVDLLYNAFLNNIIGTKNILSLLARIILYVLLDTEERIEITNYVIVKTDLPCKFRIDFTKLERGAPFVPTYYLR